ncbi:MAG: DUF1015 domain-containing protein [Oscillospiraceae bacterium]|nr:DUF1015 domain-containing protein [Oscillospiraceae bacterium]
MNNIFTPTDILLPKKEYMEKWSVIACDQFSSQKDYWERVKTFAGDSPSALNMIIPEAYLEEGDEATQIRQISTAMQNYQSDGIFETIENSFIYVERTQPDGRVRRGIVGALDLDEYEFSDKNQSAAIRASEGTVLDRLPARIAVRKAASLELPHIMTFISDKDGLVIEKLAENAENLPLLYDFSLMEGGGHIKGRRVTGEAAENVMAAIRQLHTKNDILMIMGDGNHSLAAAKVYWDELKLNLTEQEKEKHPARRALVEINNVYDPAISFEAIHRVLFNIDAPEYIKAFEDAAPKGSDYIVKWYFEDKSGEIGIKAECIGDMMTIMQDFMDNYVKKTGSIIDYIHGDDTSINLAKDKNTLGLLLPSMDKSDIFETVALRGVFPRKSFSVGHAKDKRYYLECRRI